MQWISALLQGFIMGVCREWTAVFIRLYPQVSSSMAYYLDHESTLPHHKASFLSLIEWGGGVRLLIEIFAILLHKILLDQPEFLCVISTKFAPIMTPLWSYFIADLKWPGPLLRSLPSELTCLKESMFHTPVCSNKCTLFSSFCWSTYLCRPSS